MATEYPGDREPMATSPTLFCFDFIKKGPPSQATICFLLQLYNTQQMAVHVNNKQYLLRFDLN
jgi:hypothetical protein